MKGKKPSPKPSPFTGRPTFVLEPPLSGVPLPVLTKAYADAKRREASGKKEAEVFRPELLTRTEIVVGYQDESIEVREASEVDYEDEDLVAVLKAEKLWGKATTQKPDAGRVQACAKLNPNVDAVLRRLQATKVRKIHVRPAPLAPTPQEKR